MLAFKNIEYLILWHSKSSFLGDFTDFPENLRYLELNLSNIRDFQGIGKLQQLKRLELHYCRNLESDLGLSKLANSLEFLRIDNSKKFVPNDELLALKNLRVLCLNECGRVENLDFLKYFPKIIDFRFVGTTVVNGDLTPIVEHPTIRTVGYMNKRHYNIKDDEMEILLKNKNNGEEFKTIVWNGEWYTHRYIY